MNKKHETKWVIGTIIAIIGILAAIGFFNNSNIILLRQGNSDYTCPTYFYSNSEFDISFKNVGTAGTNLCVSLNSPNKNITFIKRKDCLYVETNKKPTPFNFIINASSIYKIDSVTIDYTYVYTKWIFITKNETISCFYDREKGTNISLKLKYQVS